MARGDNTVQSQNKRDTRLVLSIRDDSRKALDELVRLKSSQLGTTLTMSQTFEILVADALSDMQSQSSIE